MDNNTQHARSIRTVTMLLAAVMALPLVSQIFLSSPSVQTAQLVSLFQSDIEAVRQQAVEDRDRLRAQRRAYTRAVERCRDRLANGEEVTCPDINDANTYDATTYQPQITTTSEDAATKHASDSYSVQQLSTQERRVLRTYTRAGFCSKAAGIMLYSLCMDIVGETEVRAPVGIENENAGLRRRHIAGPNSVKLRLQMIDEAISGTRRSVAR